jgi:hypothetical protein
MKDLFFKWIGRFTWTRLVAVGTFYFGSMRIAFEAPMKAEAWFDKNYDRKSAPFLAQRAEQFKNIDNNFDDVKKSLRNIETILMEKRNK